MSPATAWTELTATGVGWQMGIPVAGGNPDDFYVDVLFEDSIFFSAPGPPSWVELTVSATSGTELMTPSTSWTEVTI